MTHPVYKDEIVVTGNSAIGGKINDTTTFDRIATLAIYPEIVKMWALDDDLQELSIASANIGFHYTFTKQYRKDGDE